MEIVLPRGQTRGDTGKFRTTVSLRVNSRTRSVCLDAYNGSYNVLTCIDDYRCHTALSNRQGPS